MINKENSMTIKVVKKESLHERFTLVEVVERKTTPACKKQANKWVHDMGHWYVSYKGARHTTFLLPESYGDCHGQCIDITPRHIYM